MRKPVRGQGNGLSEAISDHCIKLYQCNIQMCLAKKTALPFVAANLAQ